MSITWRIWYAAQRNEKRDRLSLPHFMSDLTDDDLDQQNRRGSVIV
jgi:hypothetical protein